MKEGGGGGGGVRLRRKIAFGATFGYNFIKKILIELSLYVFGCELFLSTETMMH